MAQVQQRVLRLLLAASVAGPAQQPVGKIQPTDFHEFRDFIANTFFHSVKKKYPAQDVDLYGEVPDSAWYENRHATRRMSIAELMRGPGDAHAPSLDGPWTVVAAKHEGVTPGFQIKDARGRKYLLKFDPPGDPELATGAEVVASKFFYALGYHVPENYIVRFERSRLVTDPKPKGKPVRDQDIDRALALLPKDAEGRYRAVASLFLQGEPAGPFFFHGVREGDPNDTIPHENRRELRGLYVMSAWLNHTDAKAGNTLDMVVTENGVRYIKHHLIDFGACLGSASLAPKSPRQGHEYMLDGKPALVQLFTLGVYVPKWARVRQAGLPAVGSFEAEAFDPRRWKPNYPNPAFDNRLPDDEFWAARKVMAFHDDEIRAIVRTGQYSDPRAEEWIAKTLIARRDKIAAAFSDPGLPLDRVRVRGNRIEFDSPLRPADLEVAWMGLDRRGGTVRRIPWAASLEVPEACVTPDGARCAVRIVSPESGRSVTVYLAGRGRRAEVVGLERGR